MKIIRKFAVQGHAIPRTVSKPQGPFPPEVLQEPKAAVSTLPDQMPEEMDGVRYYRCRDCGESLRGDHLDNHDCEEM